MTRTHAWSDVHLVDMVVSSINRCMSVIDASDEKVPGSSACNSMKATLCGCAAWDSQSAAIRATDAHCLNVDDRPSAATVT
jgi:hypothetical protein